MRAIIVTLERNEDRTALTCGAASVEEWQRMGRRYRQPRTFRPLRLAAPQVKADADAADCAAFFTQTISEDRVALIQDLFGSKGWRGEDRRTYSEYTGLLWKTGSAKVGDEKCHTVLEMNPNFLDLWDLFAIVVVRDTCSLTTPVSPAQLFIMRVR